MQVGCDMDDVGSQDHVVALRCVALRRRVSVQIQHAELDEGIMCPEKPLPVQCERSGYVRIDILQVHSARCQSGQNGCAGSAGSRTDFQHADFGARGLSSGLNNRFGHEFVAVECQAIAAIDSFHQGHR